MGRSEPQPELDLEDINATLVDQGARERIAWAVQQFGQRLVMSSSFGAHSAVMLHLVSEVAPKTPVIVIDTGYLFPETYTFMQALSERLTIQMHVYNPAMSAARQEALYGKLWEQGEEGVQRYLQLNKVEPMQRALEELQAQAWLSGLRHHQNEHRNNLRPVELQDGRYKIHPILQWSEEEVERYIQDHELPFHPLYAQGYRSVGDWHSTLPTVAGQDPREGRILGKNNECGLHLPLSEAQDASLKSSGL